MLIKCIDAVVFHCKPQERADFDYFAYLHSFFEKNTIMMTHRLFSSTNRSSYNLFHSISSKQTKTVKLRSFRFKPIKKKKRKTCQWKLTTGNLRSIRFGIHFLKPITSRISQEMFSFGELCYQFC